jgi:dCMP deaminase
MFDEIVRSFPLYKTSWDIYFFTVALAGTLRADCTRRQVGCVLVSPDNRIIATGYNSPPKGERSKVQEYYDKNTCRPPEGFPCCKDKNEPKNSSYDYCSAIHAESNALFQLGATNHYDYVTMYLVARDGQTGELTDIWPPCIYCSRLIKNSNVDRIKYLTKETEIKVGSVSELSTTL